MWCRGVRVLVRFTLFAVACGMFLSGCAGRQTPAEPTTGEASPTEPAKAGGIVALLSLPTKLFPRKPKTPQAVPAQLLGEIRQVNEDGRFVLIDASVSSAVEAGDLLVSLADKTQTAELKLTTLRSGSFFIADTISGKPAVGERVFKK